MANGENGAASANPATVNAAAHTATGLISGAATGYLVSRRGADPYLAAVAVSIVGGLLGRIGSWANDTLAGGSKSLIVRLFSSWG